jgi:hypothetical protein
MIKILLILTLINLMQKIKNTKMKLPAQIQVITKHMIKII